MQFTLTNEQYETMMGTLESEKAFYNSLGHSSELNERHEKSKEYFARASKIDGVMKVIVAHAVEKPVTMYVDGGENFIAPMDDFVQCIERIANCDRETATDSFAGMLKVGMFGIYEPNED